MSKDGIETNPKKVKDIREWPVPKTVTDVKSFLGLTNYYRKFMLQYSRIAKPLQDLTSGENAYKKKTKVNWTAVHQEAFERLKEIVSSAPILAYADYTKPFKVYTDASELGLGAVLAQIQEDKEPAIAFVSRSLSKAEKRYDAHKLEFLALKWAITDRFHEYLYGGSFEVFTDNNPLMYVLTMAKLDATGQRWIAALALYNFKIFYRSWKLNVNADALSRIPWPMEEKQNCELYDESVVHAMVTKSNDIECPQEPEDYVLKAAQFYAPDYVPQIPIHEWKKLQRKDPTINRVIELLQSNQLSRYKIQKNDSSDIRCYMKVRKYLHLLEGILHRRVHSKHQSQEVNQMVLPPEFRK